MHSPWTIHNSLCLLASTNKLFINLKPLLFGTSCKEHCILAPKGKISGLAWMQVCSSKASFSWWDLFSQRFSGKGKHLLDGQTIWTTVSDRSLGWRSRSRRIKQEKFVRATNGQLCLKIDQEHFVGIQLCHHFLYLSIDMCLLDAMDGWMEGRMDGRMDGWTDGGMEGWRDGGMEGWMDGWMDLCMYV